MMWRDLDPSIQAVAEHVLTVRQLDVWRLELAGMSTRRIALILGVSRWNVRDHLDAAHDKLYAAGIRRTGDQWTLEEAA